MEKMVTPSERYDQMIADGTASLPGSGMTLHMPRLRQAAHGTVLELGVHVGVSTTALLAGVVEQGGNVWSVDINASCGQVWAGHPQWHFVCANSFDEKTIIEAGLPLPLDMLFIDTAHEYHQTLAELETWGPKVKAGGYIFLHDTDLVQWFPQVRQAIREFCDAHDEKWYWFVPGDYGLGIIRWGKE